MKLNKILLLFIVLFIFSNEIKISSFKNLNFLQTKTSMLLQKITKYIFNYETIEININLSDLNDSSTLFSYFNENLNKISITSKKSQNDDKEELLSSEGTYNRSRYSTGWDFFESKTYSNVNPIIQCYSIGLIEGILSQNEIYDYLNNFKFAFDEEDIKNLKGFFKQSDENIKNILNSKLNNKNINNIDIKQIAYIGCLNAQLNGLYQGYNLVASDDKKIDIYDLYFLNSEGNYESALGFLKVNNVEFNDPSEFYKEENLLKYYNSTSINEIWKKLIRKSHCSAVFKLIKDKKGKVKDIYFGHNTWTGFYEMLRVFKKQYFEFEGENQIIGMEPINIKFSSYPGILFSGDEFYTINDNLAVTQTSLSIINLYNLKNAIDINSYIPEFMRIMLINFISKSGKDWVKNYKKIFKNNHIYSCSFTIVDYNKLNSKKNLIFVVEEIPKSVKTKDITKEFLEKGYYSSFNLPYFNDETVKNKLGFNGFDVDFYNKNFNPREYIVQNLINDVNNLNDFENLIKYNGYKKINNKIKDDPSYDDPSNGIAARDSDFGAIDYKIVNKKLMKENKVKIYSGLIFGGENENFLPFKKDEIENEDLKNNHMKRIPDVFNFTSFIY